MLSQDGWESQDRMGDPAVTVFQAGTAEKSLKLMLILGERLTVRQRMMLMRGIVKMIPSMI